MAMTHQVQKLQSILGSTVLVVLTVAGCSQDNGSAPQRSQSKSDASVGVSDDLLAAYQNGTFELTAKQHGHSQQFIDDIKLCLKTQPFLDCLRIELDKLHNDYAATRSPSASAVPVSSPSATPSAASVSDPSKTSGCANGANLADANATYTFPNPNTIPNSTYMYGPITTLIHDSVHARNPGFIFGHAWYVRSNPATIQTICRLKGYSAVDAVVTLNTDVPTVKSTVIQWSSDKLAFEYKPDDGGSSKMTPGSDILVTLTCKGKLADACVTDQSWIYTK